MSKIDKVFVLGLQSIYDMLLPFKLSAPVLHWEQNEHSSWNVIIPVSFKPIREDRVWSILIVALELMHLYSSSLKSVSEVGMLLLSQGIDRINSHARCFHELVILVSFSIFKEQLRLDYDHFVGKR
eukprot:CAMPEP_0170542654 /NCGR_PEP_ID=MMETSP0211-20121228/2021_1 /TAXON_ID=311385 /ORGANISM="Pseudokeronopsis sp., Strain OXSARD2" /LENGTH=125 /DNA_ID=CAMNT_0010845801 /DNA_START=603 /DNA_END=980 /DNA_ORIENTATION=-